MNISTIRIGFISGGLLVLLVLAGCGEKSTIQSHLESGERYYLDGDFEAAKLEFLNLRRRDPKNARAYARLGEICLRQGSCLPAVSYLLEARKLDPDNADVRLHLAEISLVLGVRSDARKYALEVLEKAPAHDRALVIMAESATPGGVRNETRSFLRKPEFRDSPGAMLGLAILSYREKDLEAAELGLRSTLEKAGGHSKAHLALANVLVSRNKPEEAEGMYRKAAELAPDRSDEKIAYAQFLIQVGKVDPAAEQLHGLIEATPDYLPAWITLARLAFLEKDYTKAEELLGNVLARDRLQHEARLLQARIQMVRGESKEVLENLKELRSLYPAYAVIEYRLAVAYLMNAIPSNAIAALDRALKLDPHRIDARLLKARLHLRLGEPELVVESMQEFLKQVTESGLELLKEEPEFGQAELILADAYRMQGRLEDAGKIFRARIEQNPENFQAHLFLGIILRQQMKGVEARKAFERADAIDEENPFPDFQLADLDVLDGEPERALARIREIATREPGWAGPYFMIGRIQAHQESWDEAEGSLLKAIDLQPGLIRAYNLLVATYVEAEKLSEAEAGLLEIVARSPEDTTALLRLALVREELGKLREAEFAYQRVIELIPDFGPALNNLAWLYVDKLDDPGRALEIARRARFLLPEDGSVADTLGWIYYQGRDYSRAIALLREAAGKLPDDPEVRLHLGLAAYKMGLTKEARAALEFAVASKSEFTGREEAREYLNRLSGAGAPDQSLEELRRRVHEHPDDVPALLRLAADLEQQDDFQAAKEAYEAVRVVNPKQLESAVSLARLYHGPLQDFARAAELAKEARALDPSDGRPLAILGSLQLGAGHPKQAFSLLSLALESKSSESDPRVIRDHGWASYQIGECQLARASMARLAESGAKPGLLDEARVFLVLTEPDLELTPEVLTMAEAIRRTDPDHVPALMVTAAKLAADGELEGAEKIYADILSRLSDFSPAMKELAGVCLGRRVNLDKARKLALEVRRAHPEDVEAGRILGEISFRMEDYRYAIQLLKEVDGRGALDGEGLFYLGSAQIAHDANSPEGRVNLQRALDRGLPSSLEIEARAQLGGGGH